MKGIACTLLFALFSASLFAAPPGKTVICHHDAEGGFWTPISISVKAVDKHFANHDDGYPLQWTSVTGTALDEYCEVVTCPCFTYDEAMDVMASTPAFCLVAPDLYVEFWSNDGLLRVGEWGMCEYFRYDPHKHNLFNGLPEEVFGCFETAMEALEDSGWHPLCF